MVWSIYGIRSDDIRTMGFRAINLNMLTIEDKYELNKYHAKVFEVLAHTLKVKS